MTGPASRGSINPKGALAPRPEVNGRHADAEPGLHLPQSAKQDRAKGIRMVVRYDHERGNLEENAINFLHHDKKKK
jgi:hypothetical protein